MISTLLSYHLFGKISSAWMNFFLLLREKIARRIERKVADSVRTCIGDFLKKSPMYPKTFIEEDKIPSVGSANNAHPSEGFLMKVLLPIVALGATSPCMGKPRTQTVK